MEKAGRGGRSEKPGSVIPRLIKRLGLTKKYQLHQLFYDWERVVGKGIALHVKPVRLDFHTLYLKADSPVWANQLVFMQEELLQRINGYAASHLVHEIRFGRESFWQKPRATRAQLEAEEEKKLIPAVPLPESSDAEIQLATSLCQEINDDDLKNAASKAMQRILTRQRVRSQEGWQPCSSCGVLCPKEDTLCRVCRRQKKTELHRRLRRYLEIKPWAAYSEIFEQFECSPELLREVKVNLLQTWLGQLTYSEADRKSELAKKLVMLYTARAPEDVSDDLQEKILKKLRFDLRPVPREEKDGGKIA